MSNIIDLDARANGDRDGEVVTFPRTNEEWKFDSWYFHFVKQCRHDGVPHRAKVFVPLLIQGGKK